MPEGKPENESPSQEPSQKPSQGLADTREGLQESMLVQHFLLFWRWKALVVGCGVAAMAVAAVLHFTSARQYRASTLILPPQTDSGKGLPKEMAGLVGEATGGRVSVESPAARHVDILESERTLDALVDRFNLLERYETGCRDGARGRLSERCEFEITAGNLVKISVVDEDSRLAAEMAAAFVEVLSEIDHEISKGKAGRQREFLEKRVAEVEKELRSSQEAWREFQEEHRLVRVDEGLRATATVMGELEARRIAKDIELQVLETVYAKENPEVEILRTEVNRLAKKLEELARTGIRSGDEDKEHQWLFPAIKRVPALALEQMELERKLSLHTKLYELLATQMELARIAEARERTSIEIVSPPTPPARPIGLGLVRKVVIAAVAAGLALLLVGFVVLTDPVLARRVLHRDGTG